MALTWILPLAVFAFAIVWRSSRNRKTSYPPGPKPRFFLGNTFDIPTDRSWVTYGRWSKECKSECIQSRPQKGRKVDCGHGIGSIIHATALDKHLVVLNSPEDAVELLEKRAQIYSSRPRIPMLEMYGSPSRPSLV